MRAHALQAVAFLGLIVMVLALIASNARVESIRDELRDGRASSVAQELTSCRSGNNIRANLRQLYIAAGADLPFPVPDQDCRARVKRTVGVDPGPVSNYRIPDE
jgi:hypothetical protein